MNGGSYLKTYISKYSLLSSDRISETEIEADTYAYNFIIIQLCVEDIQNYIKKF